MVVTSMMATRIVDNPPTPVEVACEHLRGNKDNECPTCWGCRRTMAPGDNVQANCPSCAYKALDVLAKEIVRLDDSPELFAVQRRVAALEKELIEYKKTKMILTFISEMSLTVSQTAVGPLNETQLSMIKEIKSAARGTVPDWFLKDWEERPK